jgi:hypothetical protein
VIGDCSVRIDGSGPLTLYREMFSEYPFFGGLKETPDRCNEEQERLLSRNLNSFAEILPFQIIGRY